MIPVAPIGDPFGLLDSIDPLVASITPSPESYITSGTPGPSSIAPSPASISLRSASTSGDPVPARRASRLTRVQQLELELAEARAEAQRAHCAHQNALAHCKLAQEEVVALKRKVNAGQNAPRKRPKLNVNARCLTSSEGRRLAAEQEAARHAKAQKKLDAQNQRTAQEAERERLRRARGPDFAFTGSLSTKNKPDLVDIALDLGLDSVGTKAVLLDRIKQHFDEHPEKRSEHRYQGMFSPSRSRQLQNDENMNPNPVAQPQPSQPVYTPQPQPGPSTTPFQGPLAMHRAMAPLANSNIPNIMPFTSNTPSHSNHHYPTYLPYPQPNNHAPLHTYTYNNFGNTHGYPPPSFQPFLPS